MYKNLIMSKEFKNSIIILSLLFSSCSVASTTNIKLYNWWEYLDTEVIKDLQNTGFKTNLTVYSSNSQSISRLYKNHDNFDLAIVSKMAMKSLDKYDVFDKNIFKEIIKKRKYNKLTRKEDYCIPYLWGPTVYASNISNSNKRLFEKNINKIVIDDPMEFFSMFMANDECKLSDKECFSQKFKEYKKKLTIKNFKSELEKSDIEGEYIFYGWLGALRQVEKYKNIIVTIPKKPVIGQDYICALKKRKASSENVLKYAIRLSNTKNSRIHEKKMGYYSPYLIERKKEKFKSNIHKLKKQFEILIEKGSFIELPSVKSESFIYTRKIWSEIRYE